MVFRVCWSCVLTYYPKGKRIRYVGFGSYSRNCSICFGQVYDYWVLGLLVYGEELT